MALNFIINYANAQQVVLIMLICSLKFKCLFSIQLVYISSRFKTVPLKSFILKCICSGNSVSGPVNWHNLPQRSIFIINFTMQTTIENLKFCNTLMQCSPEQISAGLIIFFIKTGCRISSFLF